MIEKYNSGVNKRLKIYVYIMCVLLTISTAGNLYYAKMNRETREMINVEITKIEGLISADKDLPLRYIIMDLERENNLLRERIVTLEDALTEKR